MRDISEPDGRQHGLDLSKKASGMQPMPSLHSLSDTPRSIVDDDQLQELLLVSRS